MSTTTDLEQITREINREIHHRGITRIPKHYAAYLEALRVKRCPGCATVLELEEFTRNAHNRDGLSHRCRGCETLRLQRNHERNRDRNNQRRARRYRNHRLSEQLTDGYRRAVEAGNRADEITAEDLLCYWESVGIDPLRSIYSGDKLTDLTRSLDHSVPISRGGSHTLSNIVPCTTGENSSKFTRTGARFVLSRPALELDPGDLSEDVKRALSITAPERARRSVLVQLEEVNPDA